MGGLKGPTLTREIAERILENIRNGLPMQSAAMAEGYSCSCLSNWRKIFKKHPNGVEGDDYINACVYFFEQVKVSTSKFKLALVKKWNDSGDWKAAQALLETRFPDEFGHKARSVGLVLAVCEAIKNRDMVKMVRLLGKTSARSLTKALTVGGFLDDTKPTAQMRSDEELAAKAEELFQPTADEVAGDAPTPD